MPATFGRRRRQNSEDIEDVSAPGTQTRTAEDVSDAEPSQRQPKVEKTKARKEKKPAVTQESDDDAASEDDGSEDEAIDVSTLKDQPLQRGAADKLKGVVDDWTGLESTTRQQWAMVANIAGSIADATDEDQAQKPIEELDKIMQELVDLSHEMTSHGEALHEVRQKIIQGEEIDNAFQQYLETAEAKKAEYLKETTRQKYAKNQGYIEFKSAIWEAQNPDAPMPPMTDFIEKEDGDDSDDDDLEIGGQTQDFKCPISLTLMTDPLTSTLCGHSYSATAIRSMLGNSRKPCPAAGCKKLISIHDCKPNLPLAKKAKQYAQRIARQEEEAHSDVDEVIE